MTVRWIDIPGGIFKSRMAGYQIAAEYGGRTAVLLDTTDKMARKLDTLSAQAVCCGEKNIIKVTMASILLAQTGGDIRRSYYQVFDRYGSDISDAFPWPDGMLPGT